MATKYADLVQPFALSRHDPNGPLAVTYDAGNVGAMRLGKDRKLAASSGARRVVRSVTALIGLLGADAAQAITGDDADPPVIVVNGSSAGDSVVLTDSPVNGTVLSGEALTRQHPANLADLLDTNLGSVTLSNGTGSPYQSDVSYRGFAATSLLGSPTGLSVWLDGVRMNEPFGSIVNWDLIPMNALSSVAVLPGSNPLFGLNTLGGALALATKNGADNRGAAVTVQGGSFNRRAVLGEAGGRLANGNLDWFVSGNYDDQDGYRWYTHTLVSQAYGKLRWHGIASNAELGVIWANTSLNGTQGLPIGMLGTPQMAYTWPDNVANNQVVINLKADTRLSSAVKLAGNLYYRRSDSQSTNSNASLGDNCDGVTYDCSALAPGGTARDLYGGNPFMAGVGRFSPYTGSLPIHDYTSGINTTLVISDVAQHTFGGNALIDVDTSIAGLANDLNLGGSAELSTIRYTQNTDLAYLVNYQTVLMPWNFRYGGLQGNPLINAVAIASRNNSINLFVRDMIKPTRTLSLTASLSFAATRVSLSGTNSTLLDPGGGYMWTGADGNAYYNPAYLGALYWQQSTGTLATAAAPQGGLAGPEIDPVNGAHSYHRINPAIGLAWNPRGDFGLFASYSEAMRAPTAIELACADPARPCSLPTGFNGDPDLKAVVAHSVEAGFRGTIARRFAINGAVYRTQVDNDIQFIYDPSGLGYFANPGRTERKGFELGLSADLAPLHLSASYGHVAATYRDSFIDANGDTVAPGNRIAGIPGQSLKLRATVQPIRPLTIGANLIMVSSQYAHGDEANRNPAVAGYTIVNLDLRVVPVFRVELFAKVSNLFDVHYATFGVLGTDIYTGTNTQFLTPAPGRAVLGGVTYSFGRGHADAD
jgi:outer membrane receptor protein involved in Fe transport